MFRRAVTRFWNRSASAAAGSREFSTDLASTAAADEAFVSAWRRAVPNVEPPKTPLSFMQPRLPSSSKLKINFLLPYASELSNKEVDMIIVPATTGEMGILPGHVATIAELKSGVVSVHEGGNVKKYFVSSGFAFVHSNSIADIMALEAVPVEQIDPNTVQKLLADFIQKLSSASTDLQKAEAQIGVDVLRTLNSAVMS